MIAFKGCSIEWFTKSSIDMTQGELKSSGQCHRTTYSINSALCLAFLSFLFYARVLYLAWNSFYGALTEHAAIESACYL